MAGDGEWSGAGAGTRTDAQAINRYLYTVRDNCPIMVQ